MNPQANAVLEQAQTVTPSTTHAWFDLKDYIQSIKTPDVAAQCAQSVAFAVDVAIQGAVRALFKNLRMRSEEAGFDNLDAMTTAMRERGFTEKVIRMAGKDELGPVATIVQLNHIRAQWHELAKDLTGMTFDWQGVPRVYEIHSIEELLARDVSLGVRPDTERKIRLTVTRRADDASKEDIEQAIERRMNREKQRAKDISLRLMDQRETLVTLYAVITDMIEDGEFDALDITPPDYGAVEVEFHDLDVSLQRAMIEGAIRGAGRAEDFATQSSSITDSEFDAVSFAVIKLERELKAVLKSPKFVAQQRSADAGRQV